MKIEKWKYEEKEIDECFEIIKRDYINTINLYNQYQAKYALKELIMTGESSLKYFTNKFKDRVNLKTKILNSGINVMKVILKNIDLKDLDVNNIDEVITRFETLIGVNVKVSKNVY